MAKNKKQKKHRFFWFMVKLQIVLMLAVLGCVGYYYFGGYAQQVESFQEEAAALVAASDEKMFVPSRSSAVYDAKGNLVSERAGEKDAEYIAYEDIPASFISAIISIEDKKYYKHHGIDYKAVLRAAKAMIVNGEVTQGGSTITMQLAKLMFMDSSTKTWEYKVQQMFIALELEKRYTKTQIMEFYLNNIYFANGYYGIEAACHGYFDCEPNELDISQVAFLLAIPNSPTYYDPLVNSDNTLKRRDLILKNLWEDGRLSDDAYYSAKSEKIVLKLQQRDNALWNNYVDTYAYRCATMALMAQRGFQFQYYFDTDEEKQEYSEQYDELYADCQKELYSGGYSIYTSIDMDVQQSLQDTIDTTLADFTDVTEDGVYDLQSAAVCIDNNTGYVVAIVGGRSQEYSTYTLNRAYQSYRQPGSSIKPLIVYAPSFENGYTLDSLFMDEELEDGPSNSGGYYYGEVTLETAIAKSINTVAWQLYEELTPEVGLSYLKKMNFTQIVAEDYGLATALGGFTKGVSPLEMAAGFATIENDGVYREPTCIRTILDSDMNVIYTSQMAQEVIYSETAARMTTAGLEAVMEEGTGKKHKLVDMPCAGKTGTTNQNKDGWFVGYTRYYTTSVWVGCDTPKEVEDLKGSTYPGLIWNTFMTQLHEGFAPMDFLPYAQLSDEFLDAQEAEKNRHNVDDEDGDGIPDEEENQDGENAEEQQPEDDAAGQTPDEEQPEDNNEGDGTGDEETPEDNNADDAGNADEETPEDNNAGDAGTADEETPEDNNADEGNADEQPPEDDNGDAGEADYPGADENQDPVG
jgi:membrane peptidoglycan carboxypeptidase